MLVFKWNEKPSWQSLESKYCHSCHRSTNSF
jgi:hypothetical protein